jgi:hypothetical protein
MDQIGFLIIAAVPGAGAFDIRGACFFLFDPAHQGIGELHFGQELEVLSP